MEHVDRLKIKERHIMYNMVCYSFYMFKAKSVVLHLLKSFSELKRIRSKRRIREHRDKNVPL